MLARREREVPAPALGFEDLFDTFFNGWGDRRRFVAPALPPMRIWQDDEAFYVQAEVPGFDMDDLEILVQGRQLTLRGNRRFDLPEGAHELHNELRLGSFERSLQLPQPVDSEHVGAELSRGLLEVRLPKESAHRPRKIKIRSR